jgi:hypothetical protein
MTVMLLLVKKKKIPGEKRSVKLCFDATASSFVTKVQGEVFAHFYPVTVKYHSTLDKKLVMSVVI